LFVVRHVGTARLVSLDTLVSTCSTGSTKSNVSSRVEPSGIWAIVFIRRATERRWFHLHSVRRLIKTTVHYNTVHTQYNTRGQSSRRLDNSRTGQLAEMFYLKFAVYNSFNVQIQYSNSMIFKNSLSASW